MISGARAYANAPATAPLRHVAMVPDSKERVPSATISAGAICFLVGAYYSYPAARNPAPM